MFYCIKGFDVKRQLTVSSSFITADGVMSHYSLLYGIKWFGMSQHKQSYSSVWENPAFKIGRNTVLWKTWYSKGVVTIKDLFEEEIF